MDKSEKKELGLQIRRWREDRHVDRAELAARIGVSEKTLQHAELGYQKLGGAALAALERIMSGGAYQAVGAGRPEYGSRPVAASPIGAERIADLVEDEALRGQARRVAELLGVPYRTALVSVIEMRLKSGGPRP